MDKEWQEIKKCFTAMSSAPDVAPAGVRNLNDLCFRAARYMKPKSDVGSVTKLSKRILFIAFGEF